MDKMGDEAEGVFEEWAKQNGISFVSYGWRRPPFTGFQLIDPTLRHAADYFCENTSKKRLTNIKNKNGYQAKHFFLEVKGVGADGILKLKELDLKSLKRWSEFQKHPIAYFCWSSKLRKVSTSMTLDSLKEMTKSADVDYFHDAGKPKKYFKIPVGWLDWEPFEPTVEA